MRVFYKIFVTLLLLALVPQSVFSLDGLGQSGNPYLIKNIDDLKELRYKIDGKTYIYVRQEADIDVSTATTNNAIVLPLTSASYNIMTGFSFNKSFYGEYDGNGKSLTGWVLPTGKRGSGGDFYMSVFGKIGNKSLPKQTIIKNLTIDGALINIPNNAKDNWCVSFIAGYSENSIIENCHVKNSTVTGIGPVIFGAISSKNFGKIENCSVLNTNFITSKQSQKVGSICGDNSGDIKNCSAYSVSLTASSIIGGIIGAHANGVVENCSFNGKIGSCSSGILFENIGGLCGRITDGSLINCFAVFSNKGECTNVGQIGGLIGTVDATTKSLVVKNCYSYPQFKASLYTDADIVVGRDPKREDPSRVFESCYCYEYSYGKELSSSYTYNNKPFSDGYKKKHDIGISSSDFMKSGCFAEVLRDYHNAHLKGENPWREDVELQNDTLPVLKFMVDDAYDVDPFCHPVIFTLSHSESGNVTNLNGKVKYITDDQNSSSWAHGIEVKVGNGDWAKLSDVANKNEGNTIIFNKDYTYSKSKTTVYRAYTYLKTDKTKIAYGKIDTICVGSSSGPEIIEGCDSVKYDGRMFYYPNDNGTYKNITGEEVIIKLGHNERQELPDKIGECGESTINVNGTLFDKSGYFEINSFTNLTGCTTTSYANVKLYPTYTKDSIKVLGLNENSYTYTPLGGAAPVSIKVGNEYETTPKLLITDRVQYSNRKGCDSLVLNVKYVIPVKYTSGSDKTWSCEPRVYKGVTYDKDTIVVDTIKTPDSTVPGGYLYEINSYYVKVKIPKKIEKTITSCGEINLTECCGCSPDFDDPDKCFTTTPFDVTDVVKSRVCDCDSIIYVTHYYVGERPTRDTTVVSCGPYTYEYKGKKTIWKKSGDYTVTRSGKNIGSCDNDTIVTYHVTIGESTSYNDSTIHGCGKVVYKTLSGETKIFDISQVFVDEVITPEGCVSKRTVHVYIHKASDKSPIIPVTGCAPFNFVKLNGDTIVLNEGTHVISDTLKSLDGCGCDSIIKNTKLIIAEPQPLIISTETQGSINVGSTIKFNAEFISSKDYTDLTYIWSVGNGYSWSPLIEGKNKSTIDYIVYHDIKTVKCDVSYRDNIGDWQYVESNVIDLDVKGPTLNIEVVGNGVRNVNTTEKEVPALSNVIIKMVDLPFSNVSNPRISFKPLGGTSSYKTLDDAVLNEDDLSWSVYADKSGRMKIEVDVEVPTFYDTPKTVTLKKEFIFRMVYSPDKEDAVQELFFDDFGYFKGNEYHYVKYEDGTVIDSNAVETVDASLPSSVKWMDDQNGFIKEHKYAMEDPRIARIPLDENGNPDRNNANCWSKPSNEQPYICWCENGYRVEDGYYAFVSDPAMADGGGKTGNGAKDYWSGTDHTGSADGSSLGAMLMVNCADVKDKVIYERDFEINGDDSDVKVFFSAFVSNAQVLSDAGTPVNIRMDIYEKDGTEVLTSIESGDVISRNYGANSWSNLTASFPLSKGKFTLKISNNAASGSGNDILLDDISLKISSPVQTQPGIVPAITTAKLCEANVTSLLVTGADALSTATIGREKDYVYRVYGSDVTLQVSGIFGPAVDVVWEKCETKPNDLASFVWTPVATQKSNIPLVVSVTSDVIYRATFNKGMPGLWGNQDQRALLVTSGLTSDISKACPNEAVELDVVEGKFASRSQWYIGFGKETLKSEKEYTDGTFTYTLNASNKELNSYVILKYDEFNCSRASQSPRITTNNVKVDVSSDCKAECLTTSTGDYYVGTDFDPNKANPMKIPDDIESHFGEYEIDFQEAAGFTHDKYWLGSNASDFFGQDPSLDVSAGVVGQNNYLFAQGNIHNSDGTFLDVEINDNIAHLRFQVWDKKPDPNKSGVRGKSYRYKMRMYIQADKCHNSIENAWANARFKPETEHGRQSKDCVEAYAYDNATGEELGHFVVTDGGWINFKDVFDVRNIDTYKLIRFEVVFYGTFPANANAGLNYFTFTPRFEQFGCAKVAFDYISAEVENVCLSPNVVCMGESTIANAAGFPRNSTYEWYKQNGSTWEKIDEISGFGDEFAKVNLLVDFVGKKKYKLHVTATGYEREFEFTVGGKNCSVPLEPMTIDCSKIDGIEKVLGPTDKSIVIDLAKDVPFPTYTSSCDPDPTMTIDIVVKDLDGKKLVELNQSRSVTFPMSRLSTTNTKVESPAGTISLKYTIKDGCGREETCEAVITVSDKTAPNVNCDLIPNYTAYLKNQKGCVAVPGDYFQELPKITLPRLQDLNGVDGVITGEYMGRLEKSTEPAKLPTAGFSTKLDYNAPYNKGITWILWKFSEKSGNAEYCLQKITVIDDKKPNVTCPTIDDLGALDVDTLTCNLKPSSVIAKIKEVSKLPYGFDECSSTPKDSLEPTLYYRIPKEGDELHEIKSSQMNDPIFETGIKYELVWVFKKIGGAYVDESVSVECPVSFMAEDQDAPEFDCSSLTDIFVYPNYSRSMVYDNFASGSGQVGDNSNMTYTLKNYFDNGSLSMHEDVQDVCGGKVTIEVKITDPDGKTSVMKTLDEFMKFQFKENPDLRQLNVYTITYTFTDARFNSKSCEQKVTVTRNLPPVPDCKTPTITMYKDENCDAIYNLKLADIPTASVKYYHEKRYGECSAGKPVTTKAAGPGGSIPIKFDEFIRSESASKLLDATVYPDSVRLYDANGNVVAVKNPLTTTDKIVTKSVWFRYFDGDGVKYCAEDVEYGSAEANISNFKTLPSIVNNYNLPVGENRYVWYFSNAYDKSDPSAKKLTDSCVVTVIVKDTISPVLDCSIFDNPKKFYADQSCELSQSQVKVVKPTLAQLEAKDNCTATDDLKLSWVRTYKGKKSTDFSAPYKVGVTTLDWVVTDESGNSASCLQTIEVLDTIGPKVDCDVVTPPLTAYADANCVAEADVVKKVGLQIPEIDDDPCSPTGGKIKGVGVRSDGKDIMTDAYPKGVTTIVWTFTDAAGASSVCKQRITILDTIKPTFDCGEILDTTVALASDKCELTLEEVIKILGSHKAVDNCDGEITGKPMLDVDGVKEIELKAPFTALHKDTTYHFIWHFIDKAGNDKTCDQYLTVQDTTPPDASEACKNLTDKEVVAVDCELPFSKLDVNLNSSIIDKCDGEIKAKVQAFLKKYDGTEERYDDEEILNVTFPVGTHKFLYIYTDKAGLSDTCVMYRTIVDKVKPIIWDCFDDTVMANVSSDVRGMTYDELKDLIIIPKSYDNCDAKANDGAVSFIEPTVKRYFWNSDENSDYVLVVDGDNEAWKKEPFPVGLTKLVFTFTDKSGNVDSCIKYVNVFDDCEPNFDCSKIAQNPYCPVAKPGECEVKIGDIWSILDKEYIATRSCTDELIPGVLTLNGSTNRVPADYVLEVGRDYHLTWEFRSMIDGKVKTCDQIIRPNHQNYLEVHCENLTVIDTIMKAVENQIPGNEVITKFPFALDPCAYDTIWGVPHRSDSLEISDPFPAGNTHITWTIVSPYNVLDTAYCLQDLNIKGNKHFDLNCDELTPAMHRVVEVCGPIVMSDTLKTPVTPDPCANPDSAYYMRPGVGTRSDDSSLDPIEDSYPLGQTWIQWVFTDFTKSVSDTCNQLVDVRTKLPLKVDCDSINRDTIVIAVAEGTCDVPAPQVMDSLIYRGYPFAKHPCLSDTFVGVPTRPNGLTMDDPYHVGPNEIIWVFTDKKTHTLVDSVIACTQIVQVGDINVPPVDCSQMPDTLVVLDPFDCEIEFTELGFNIKPVYDLCSGAHIDSVVTRSSMPGLSSKDPGADILGTPFKVGVDTVYWNYNFGSYKFLCTQVITVKDSTEPYVDCDTINDELIVLPEGVCEITKEHVLDSIKQPYAYEYCDVNVEIKGIPQLLTVSNTGDSIYSDLPSKFNVGEPYRISWLFKNDSLSVAFKRCDIDLTIKSSNKPIFNCDVYRDTIKKYAIGTCDVNLDDQILPIPVGKDACVTNYDVPAKGYKVDTVAGVPTYTLLAEMNDGTPSYKVAKLEVGVYKIAWVFASKYSTAQDTCVEMLNVLTDKKIDIACVDLPTFEPKRDDSCSMAITLDAPVAKNPCTNEVILPDTVIRSDGVKFTGVEDEFRVGQTTVTWIFVDHSKTLKDSIDTCVQIVQVGDIKTPVIQCPNDIFVILPIGESQLSPDSVHLNATEPTFIDFCADTIVPLLNVWRTSGKSIADPFELGVDTVVREYLYHGKVYTCEQIINVSSAEGMTMIDVPVVEIPDFIYNGEIQTIDIPESPYYTVSGDTLPSAGTHTVIISLVDKENTAWKDGTVEDINISFTIAKATVEAPVVDSTAFVYNGDSVICSIKENDYYIVNSSVQAIVGKHTVVISLKDSVNYSWSDGSSDDLLYTFDIPKTEESEPDTLPGDIHDTIPGDIHDTIPGDIHDTIPEVIPDSVPEEIKLPESIVVSGDTISINRPGDYLYDLKFDSLAHEQGFVDVEGESGKDGIKVPIPEDVKPGVYDVTVIVTNPDSTVVEKEVKLTVPYPNSLIVRLLYDVLAVDNTSKEFVSYQWYKNGKKIDGATQQFYCDLDGIRGVYKVEVVNIAGDTLFITERKFDYIAPMFNITISKNPVNTFEAFDVIIEGISDPENLRHSSLVVYDMKGVAVINKAGIKVSNTISIGNVGEYIVVVRNADGKSISKHLLVK